MGRETTVWTLQATIKQNLRRENFEGKLQEKLNFF